MGSRQSALSCGRISLLALAVVILAGSTFATTEKLAYTFLGSPDGVIPVGGLVADAAGNLYGTTDVGGSANDCCGTVFELSPPATAGGTWTEIILHTFESSEGDFPTGTLILDKVGNLYGTTSQAAGSSHSGSVFELSPPTAPGGAWTETVLRIFRGSDGDRPSGKLAMDAQGNLYGTTFKGGKYDGGVAFELVRPTSGGSWTEKTLYNFGGRNDGFNAGPDLLLRNGILYGTTIAGGSFNAGTVFQLKAKPGLWTETILYNFPGNGSSNPKGSAPYGGVIADSAGNLYGTTTYGGGTCWCGTAYELSPPTVAGNPWTENTLYAFSNSSDGENPFAALWRDSLGNLYGTTSGGGKTSQSTLGLVFKLKPPVASGGPWTFIVLHYFSGGAHDGAHPFSALTWLSGLLYGTTENGGQNITPDIKAGTVFSVVP